ncbi:preprotein translocase subunit SecG [Polycladidibacter hongkongensis]|uniref:preprotein translocase subunit SecG n=1 Tax=Polycladidibacter hongkongensis TaxID=1647556 RepID=UPI0008325DC4|nr:preprotein translocase subunit SecG [Pseudovibrio hongkongensis]
MQTVLIVIHLMVVLAIIAMVLLQRSEGGALGMGGGGGGGGFMTSRGTANALTRGTAICAAIFFCTSLGLTLLARWDERPASLLEQVPATTQSETGEAGNGLLDTLKEQSNIPATDGPQVPAAQ